MKAPLTQPGRKAARLLLEAGWPMLALAACLWTYQPILHMRFVSDDFAQLWLVERSSWVSVLWPTPGLLHFSPLAVAYRKAIAAVAAGIPGVWTVLGLAQFAAALLVGGRLLRTLGLRHSEAGAAVLMWASFMYGYEGLVWPTVTVYQTALLSYLLALYLHVCGGARRGWMSLACFTAAALVLESALVFVAAALVCDAQRLGVGHLRQTLRRSIPALLLTAVLIGCRFLAEPVLVEPVASKVIKRGLVAGLYLGTMNQPWLLEAIFAWRGLRLVALGSLLAGGMLMMARGTPRTRVLLVLGVLHYAPFAAMAAVHPRYFSFSIPFVAALWSLGLAWVGRRIAEGLRWKGGRRAVVTAAIVLFVAWSGQVLLRDRLREWQRTGEVVERAGKRIAPFLHPGNRLLILANLPALSAPDHDVYPPAYAFLSAFNECVWPRLLRPGIELPDIWLVATRPPGNWPAVATDQVVRDQLFAWACVRGVSVLEFDSHAAELRAIPCASATTSQRIDTLAGGRRLRCSAAVE